MIEYIVNKEKRTIVAMIKFNEDNKTFKHSWVIFNRLYEVLNYLYDKDTEYSKSYYKKENKMYFPKYMSAKAKCNPEDEWNEEYGKQLARQRLVDKIHNYRNNSYKIIAKMADEIKEKLE